MLIKIERHPDHHASAKYQILRTYKEFPTYPTGYAGMFVLSWCPPLWRMATRSQVQVKSSRRLRQDLPQGIQQHPLRISAQGGLEGFSRGGAV